VRGTDRVDMGFSGRPIVAVVKALANAHWERSLVIEQEPDDCTRADGLDTDALSQLLQQLTLPSVNRAALVAAAFGTAKAERSARKSTRTASSVVREIPW